MRVTEETVIVRESEWRKLFNVFLEEEEESFMLKEGVSSERAEATVWVQGCLEGERNAPDLVSLLNTIISFRLHLHLHISLCIPPLPPILSRLPTVLRKKTYCLKLVTFI